MALMTLRKLCLIGAAATMLSGMATGSHAALLAYEGFDYATDQTLGAQSSAGGGFSTGWMSNAALTTASGASVLANSLAAPSGYTPSPAGGSAKQVPILAYRGLASSAQIDLGVDQDYYISYLAARTQELSTGSYSMVLQAGTTTVVTASVSTGGAPGLTLAPSALVSAPNSIGYGPTFLYVIKVAASAAGNDQVFLQTYASATATAAATEPTTWQVASGEAALNSVLTQMAFLSGTGRALQIDEIRIGEAWADVVPVPEPGSLVAVLFAGAAIVTRRRRGAR